MGRETRKTVLADSVVNIEGRDRFTGWISKKKKSKLILKNNVKKTRKKERTCH